MAQTIGPDIFNHSIPKRTLENGFIENKWVRLYYRETTHPIEGVDIELDIWQWTYLVSPDLTNKALSNFSADLSWDERSGLLYNSHTYNQRIEEMYSSKKKVLKKTGKWIILRQNVILKF